MTRAAIQEETLRALATVAPEVDAAALDIRAALRDVVDLDSMDFLRFVIELHRRLGVEVPEADYPELATIAGAVDYLATKLGVFTP